MEKVFRDWEIKENIGEGAFGKVYRIEREDFGHVYQAALKVIEIPRHQTEIDSMKNEGMTLENVTEYFYSVVENIVEEFTLMAKLKGNSNIVSYEDHEVIEKKDSFGWIIKIRMELLTPLFTYIQENNIAEKDIIQLGIDMCKALEVCSRYNIIHRDIKPENIFISDIGTFKLGDFGIARELEKTSSGLSKKGTKGYMAPEVYRGYRYNATADIYSLGVVLYRFLNNNRMPFMPPASEKIKYSDQERAFMMRYSGQDLPKPANAGERLSKIVLKACSYMPADRYKTASAMRMELEKLLEDQEFSEKENIILAKEDDSAKSMAKEKNSGHITDREIPGSSEENHTVWLFNSEKDTLCPNSDSEENHTVWLFNKEKEMKKEEESADKEKKAEDRPIEEADNKTIAKKKEIETAGREKKSKNKIWKRMGIALLAGAIIISGIILVRNHRVGNDTTEPKIAKTEGTPLPEIFTETPEATPSPIPDVDIPDVVNFSKKDAEKKLTECQLGITYADSEYSDRVPRGDVVVQDPKAGTKVKIGSSVTVTVSKGKEQVKLPSFVGMTKAKVKEKAKSLGLHVKFASQYSGYTARGKAISQSMKKGKKVDKGTTVTVTVSKGDRPVKETPKPAISRPQVTYRPSTKTKPKTKAKKKPKENEKDYDDYDPTFG